VVSCDLVPFLYNFLLSPPWYLSWYISRAPHADNRRTTGPLSPQCVTNRGPVCNSQAISVSKHIWRLFLKVATHLSQFRSAFLNAIQHQFCLDSGERNLHDKRKRGSVIFFQSVSPWLLVSMRYVIVLNYWWIITPERSASRLSAILKVNKLGTGGIMVWPCCTANE
jgi:hypothetical protein